MEFLAVVEIEMHRNQARSNRGARGHFPPNNFFMYDNICFNIGSYSFLFYKTYYIQSTLSITVLKIADEINRALDLSLYTV